MNIQQYAFLIISFFLSLANLYPQTNGIQLNSPEAMPSYTLFEPDGDQSVYIIDNCGQVVNTWDNLPQISLHAKLLPNGNLMFISSSEIYELDWDGNVVNRVEDDDDQIFFLYEVVKMPNGNYLSVGRHNWSSAQFTEMGFNLGVQLPTRVDVVVEIDYNTGDIVWEWNIADHVIQQRDSTLDNFGLIADHPELINMDVLSTVDWTFTESFMINGMDYNPELDQIALSVRKMSEIMIIDHSTTTEEAATHEGGNSDKGGDILYRWGNPQNYGRGDAEDRFLYLQHNPNWIIEGARAGKIICYNNGLSRPNTQYSTRYSDAPILNTPIDENGHYLLEDSIAFGPTEPDFVLSGKNEDSDFYSGYTSGAEVLGNENIFITEGLDGRLFEYNPMGELVWSYRVPSTSFIFRAEKYPLDYPAFEGRDLSPQGVVPGAMSNYPCELYNSVSTNDIAEFAFDKISTVTKNGSQIEISSTSDHPIHYQIVDILGRVMHKSSSPKLNHQVNIQDLNGQLYFVQTYDAKIRKRQVFKMTNIQ